MSNHRCLLILAASTGLLLAPVLAHASGARQAVTPRHGEMVLLRDVSTRPAYRPQPPGMALIADPSPRHELAQTLGTNDGMQELDEQDYASLGASPPPSAASTSTVGQITGMALGQSLGRVSGRDGVLSGERLGGAIAGPTGAIGRTTGSLANTITGALSQFPLSQPGKPGGGP